MRPNPYEEFQAEAVESIARDFSAKPNGRFLLVIPTGGGKTYTAVKAVHRLFDDQVLNVDVERVLWTAHRRELIAQAKETFRKVDESRGCRRIEQVRFEMISDMETAIREDPAIRMLIIDEAHHAAAASYQPAFEFQRLGILGLTATPSRHDGRPLEFERESYSIGFPDLVDRGIVLRPEVRSVKGGHYDLSWDVNEDSLEALNNSARNEEIINGLLRNVDDYKKVVIFAATKNHVTDLYRAICNSRLTEHYDSIAWITGEGNSRGIARDEFIEEERARESSILINIDVLSEGYDDPKLNAVVMAKPTRSKLVYMQSMGRAIRHNPGDPSKKAYILEVVDELPNIRYRIDNRWLYADISDSLEPAVIDVVYSSEAKFAQQLMGIYDQHSVPEESRSIPDYDERSRYSMLLFKYYSGPGVYRHLPLLINRENRLAVTNMFNFLSERMPKWLAANANAEAVFSMFGRECPVTSRADRRTIYHAMNNAVPAEGRIASDPGTLPDYIVDGYPWITFVSLRHRPWLDDDLESLVADMVNRDEVLASIRSPDGAPGTHLVRFPLPLCNSIGEFLDEKDFLAVERVIGQLREIRRRTVPEDHHFEVIRLLEDEMLPLKVRYVQSLITIARGDSPLGLKIERPIP